MTVTSQRKRIILLFALFVVLFILVSCRVINRASRQFKSEPQLPSISQPSSPPSLVNELNELAVFETPSFDIQVTTQMYGQGLAHDVWGGAEASPIDLELELYEPVGAPDNRPAILLIHGGRYHGGSRLHRWLLTDDLFWQKSLSPNLILSADLC